MRTLGSSDSASSFHFPAEIWGASGIIAAGVADWLRRQVGAWHGIPRANAIANVVEVLGWLGAPREAALSEVEKVLDVLLDAGDLGQGEAFGQPCLVTVGERFVSLPDGSAVLLGGIDFLPGNASGNGSVFRRVKDLDMLAAKGLGSELHQPEFEVQGLTYPELALLSDVNSTLGGWVVFAKSFPVVPRSGKTVFWSLPRQVRKAIALCGSLNIGTGDWELDQSTCEYLNAWLGVEESSGIVDGGGTLDHEQALVVKSDPAARLIVEAAPGSGKTFVAIARIAELIDRGVAPTRIWLLSFTRVAVEEMRVRASQAIYSASSINVATFDSFASQVVRGFGSTGGAVRRSYEETIAEASRLIADPDSAVKDFLASIEHVVIDEAQDVVGSRRELVSRFLKGLSSDCGVTVLGDQNQSIYGWQEGAVSNIQRSLLVDSSYRLISLQGDHRTEQPSLALIFENARRVLNDRGRSPEQRYDAIRALLEIGAEQRLASLDAVGSSSRSLVLFRGRRPLISCAQALAKNGKRSRMKLSNRSSVVAPWIGAILSGVQPAARLSKPDVGVLLEDVKGRLSSPNLDNAWDDLRTIAGAATGNVLVSAVCEALDRGLPLRFLSDHIGSSGPLLSTIHGAKGKEADTVYLMLPGRPAPGDPDIDWDEEARILYVGATRAKRRLIIGSSRSGKLVPAADGRLWRGARNDFSVEVGLPGDALALGRDSDPIHARSAARLLLNSSDAVASCFAKRAAANLPFEIYLSENDRDLPLGLLSESVVGHIADIAQRDPSDLPDVLSGFYIAGGTTAVLKDDSAGGEAILGVGIVPVLVGFAQVKTE
ncbi:ATP-dependent helicase [Rhizobium leguminosarum bv. viciae]|uniref:UvrD-helicase domain-containing protein n=1 Tax=Rhizobium leguminosarum TaxID=384 RepID=UPI00103B8886|nr:UvrD-helicase domain-containing protein [Rhizobium leguminosarum]TCA17367.1 ATP-dependent helicase [Rhizobium leguminosarum bv. viciae]